MTCGYAENSEICLLFSIYYCIVQEQCQYYVIFGYMDDKSMNDDLGVF